MNFKSKVAFGVVLLLVLLLANWFVRWEGALVEDVRIASPDGQYTVITYRKNVFLDLFFGSIGDASGGPGAAKVVDKNGKEIGFTEVKVFHAATTPYWGDGFVVIGSHRIGLPDRAKE